MSSVDHFTILVDGKSYPQWFHIGKPFDFNIIWIQIKMWGKIIPSS
ncbi:hypothetical protein OPIT5_30660 [Opitutaceae bacterium TAV5]|nr:hypothetical protein OPIT5_30660 [Opitutaceae bacterium TAV5]